MEPTKEPTIGHVRKLTDRYNTIIRIHPSERGNLDAEMHSIVYEIEAIFRTILKSNSYTTMGEFLTVTSDNDSNLCSCVVNRTALEDSFSQVMRETKQPIALEMIHTISSSSHNIISPLIVFTDILFDMVKKIQTTLGIDITNQQANIFDTFETDPIVSFYAQDSAMFLSNPDRHKQISTDSAGNILDIFHVKLLANRYQGVMKLTPADRQKVSTVVPQTLRELKAMFRQIMKTGSSQHMEEFLRIIKNDSDLLMIIRSMNVVGDSFLQVVRETRQPIKLEVISAIGGGNVEYASRLFKMAASIRKSFNIPVYPTQALEQSWDEATAATKMEEAWASRSRQPESRDFNKIAEWAEIYKRAGGSKTETFDILKNLYFRELTSIGDIAEFFNAIGGVNSELGHRFINLPAADAKQQQQLIIIAMIDQYNTLLETAKHGHDVTAKLDRFYQDLGGRNSEFCQQFIRLANTMNKQEQQGLISSVTKWAEIYRMSSDSVKSDTFNIIKNQYFRCLTTPDETNQFYTDIGGRDSELGKLFARITLYNDKIEGAHPLHQYDPASWRVLANKYKTIKNMTDSERLNVNDTLSSIWNEVNAIFRTILRTNSHIMMIEFLVSIDNDSDLLSTITDIPNMTAAFRWVMVKSHQPITGEMIHTICKSDMIHTRALTAIAIKIGQELGIVGPNETPLSNQIQLDWIAEYDSNQTRPAKQNSPPCTVFEPIMRRYRTIPFVEKPSELQTAITPEIIANMTEVWAANAFTPESCRALAERYKIIMKMPPSDKLNVNDTLVYVWNEVNGIFRTILRTNSDTMMREFLTSIDNDSDLLPNIISIANITDSFRQVLKERKWSFSGEMVRVIGGGNIAYTRDLMQIAISVRKELGIIDPNGTTLTDYPNSLISEQQQDIWDTVKAKQQHQSPVTTSKAAAELAEKYRTSSGDAKEEAYQTLEACWFTWMVNTDEIEGFYNDIGGHDSELVQRFVKFNDEMNQRTQANEEQEGLQESDYTIEQTEQEAYVEAMNTAITEYNKKVDRTVDIHQTSTATTLIKEAHKRCLKCIEFFTGRDKALSDTTSEYADKRLQRALSTATAINTLDQQINNHTITLDAVQKAIRKMDLTVFNLTGPCSL